MSEASTLKTLFPNTTIEDKFLQLKSKKIKKQEEILKKIPTYISLLEKGVDSIIEIIDGERMTPESFLAFYDPVKNKLSQKGCSLEISRYFPENQKIDIYSEDVKYRLTIKKKTLAQRLGLRS